MKPEDRVTGNSASEPRSVHPPSRVYLDLTNACPMKCRHCFNSSGAALDGELSDAEVRAFIDQVRDMGVPNLIFSGGEPMLRSGFLDFVTRARMRGLELTVMTTGSHVTENSARVLANLKVRVKISLDGATHMTHDALRGRGAFAAALRGIELLQSAGNQDLVVQYSLHRENLQELSALPKLLARLGVRDVVVGFIKPAGRAKVNSSLLIPPSMAADAWQEITYLSRSPHISLLNQSGTGKRRFGCPDEKLGVTSDGWMTPCAFLGRSRIGGSIREQPLEVLWKRHITRGEVFRINDRCARCPHLALSGGGCRARALYYTGDINAPDPYCCAFYENQHSTETKLSTSRRTSRGKVSSGFDNAAIGEKAGHPALLDLMDRRQFLRSSEAVIAAFAFLGLGLSGCSTCGDLCSATCKEGCEGSCSSSCTASCIATCASDCVSGCNTTCTAACASDCVSGCGSACTAACATNCSGTCQGTCTGSCG